MIDFYDFINRGDNEDCCSALMRVFPRIDLPRIKVFIDQVEPLSDLQREFYKTYIQARYDLILLPAYKRIV